MDTRKSTREKNSEIPPELRILDELSIAFILVDSSSGTTWHNEQAGKILEIQANTETEASRQCLEPLLSLCLEASRSGNLPSSREVVIETVNSLRKRLLIHCSELSGKLFHGDLKIGNSGPERSGYLLVIYELNIVESIITNLKLAQQLKHLAIGRNDPGLSQRSREEKYGYTELSRALSDMVKTADPLLPHSIKIDISVEQDFLIAISHRLFHELLCHSLLASSSFAGPFGAIYIRSRAGENGKAGKNSFLLELRAEGRDLTQQYVHPLLAHVYKLCSPYCNNGYHGERAEDASVAKRLSYDLKTVNRLAMECGILVESHFQIRKFPRILSISSQLPLYNGRFCKSSR